MWKTVAKALPVNFLWMNTLLTPAASLDNSSSARPARIVIRVWDRVHLDSRTLNRAKAVTENVFQQAGIRITWLHCSADPTPDQSGCASLPGPNDISLRIFRRSKADCQRWRPLTGGLAIPLNEETGRGISCVFYDRVEASFTESERTIPLELILGITMAHEIGHLFLAPGHSSLGIMRATLDKKDWKLAAKGELLFSAQEAESIIEGISAPSRQPETSPLAFSPAFPLSPLLPSTASHFGTRLSSGSLCDKRLGNIPLKRF